MSDKSKISLTEIMKIILQKCLWILWFGCFKWLNVLDLKIQFTPYFIVFKFIITLIGFRVRHRKYELR